MTTQRQHQRQHSILAALLIIVLCVSMLHIQPVLADGEAPPEPAATEVPTEPPTATEVATEPPMEATPIAVEATETPLAEILTQAPESTEVVVLDETGSSVPLATQEAADIIAANDPMWCPAGVLPGGAGCSASYVTISDLINNMVSNTSAYTQNGVIYFTATADAAFTLSPTTLTGGAFDTLNDYNLTLQGGWNGSTVTPVLSGQTNFSTFSVGIGTAANPWVGNITLNDIVFSSGSQAAINVYTTTGNITLSNVDITNQKNGSASMALLSSSAGNINVQNGSTFDGNGANSQGLAATTVTGSITISDTAFSDAVAPGTGNTNEGATLSAPVVTLTNVTSTGSDGDGIVITNANVVTLNNVTSSNNGTELGAAGLAGNEGSGVVITGVTVGGVAPTVVINGGTFNNNKEYGVEITNPATTNLYIQNPPTCTGNVSNDTVGCYNDTTTVDSTAPVITPIVTGTAGSNGWYTSNVTVNWSTTDAESGIKLTNGCTTSNLTNETSGVTLNCTATNYAGLSNSATVTIKIDKTAPSATLAISAGTLGSNGWYTSDVTVQTSGTESLSTPLVCTGNQFQTTDTAGTVFNGSCTNNAGLTTNATPLTVKLDKTGPTAVLSVTAGTAGANGWYTSDVTVHTSGTDLSNPVICSADQFQTTETAGAVFNGSCTNNAGLTTNTAPLTVKLDKTGPTAVLSVTARTVGANGWYTSDVTIHATGTDQSNPVICDADQFQTADTAGAVFNGSCTNDAGLTTNAVPLTVKLDKTGPTAGLSVTAGTAGTNGWYTSDVTIQTAGADLSNPVICTVDQFQTTETPGTTFNGSCTNNAGLTTNATPLTIQVDKTNPTINIVSRIPLANINGWNNTDVTVNWSCADALSGAVAANVSQTLTAEGAGQSTTGSCLDNAGNAASDTQTGINIDKTAPVLSLSSNLIEEATSAAGAVVNYSVSASDNLTPSAVVNCSPADGSLFDLGTTVVNCSSTDAADNLASGSFQVTVVDSTSPVISSHLDLTVEAATAAGAVVNYGSPSTSDDVDGSGTATCSPAPGSTFALGNTPVGCSAVDSNGNIAMPTGFIIHVVDTTGPMLNLPANITTNTAGPSGAVVNYSASSTDLVDGAVSVSCVLPSGSTFPVGSSTVNCSATDSHANTSSGSFTINVQDPDGPAITLPANITTEATSPSGATVSYSASAFDVVDGSRPVTCSPLSNSTFALGTTTVNCSASDLNSHTTSAAFLVTVEDTTAPTIAAHADITVNTASAAGATVSYNSPATSDIVDGTGLASCSPLSGSLFPVGDTQVVCSATDSHGNSAAPSTFFIHVNQQQVQPPTSVPATPESTGSSSSSIIPLTGLLGRTCLTSNTKFDVKFVFHNLCDDQTVITNVNKDKLPEKLPAGYSFLKALDVRVLNQGLIAKSLPSGTGIQIAFPIPNGLQEQYAVLYWNDENGDGKGEWIEISQSINGDTISKVILDDPKDELYHINLGPNEVDLYKIITTEKTGVFVLVKK